MHEVALAQGILDVVLDVAAGRQVQIVRVRAGELLAVSEDSLQFCFELVAQDTPAAAARLQVELTPDDALQVDGVELAGDGWQWRPDLVQHEVTT